MLKTEEKKAQLQGCNELPEQMKPGAWCVKSETGESRQELLKVEGICKSYKNFSLKDIRFDLPAGYIMGYIGQNGAGKTTTLNLITGLEPADGGRATIDGMTLKDSPEAYKEAIGYIGDSSYLPQEMRIRDIRKILKDFYPGFREETFREYVRRWELPEKARIRDFSRGMQVKLMFACVLSRDTRILILDEATNGLDPLVRKEVLGLLQTYISDGSRSVLFSTHIMEDLADIADYIFLIDRGERMFCSSREELEEDYTLVKGPREALTPELRGMLVGLEEYDFGFQGLYRRRQGGKLPAGLLTEKPSISKIMVHELEERRRLHEGA